MSQAASDRNTLLPRPDRSMMQAAMQPPPVPPSAIAIDRQHQAHAVSDASLVTLSLIQLMQSRHVLLDEWFCVSVTAAFYTFFFS